MPTADIQPFDARTMIALALALLKGTVLAGGAAACGPDSDCRIGERVYRIALPADREEGGAIPAIVFNHGYRGSAAGVMANADLRATADRLGAALIAPESIDGGWDLPNAPRIGPQEDGAAELAYFDRLLDDAIARFGLDPARIMVTGFSSGGMMTWTLACRRGTRFMGFAPIAGTFWGPIPEACPDGPVPLVHVHGTDDRVVPLSGRPIADTRQGDVFEALALMRATGFADEAVEIAYGDRRCLRWRVEGEPIFLDFCRHPGGHVFTTEDIARAFRLIMEAG